MIMDQLSKSIIIWLSNHFDSNFFSFELIIYFYECHCHSIILSESTFFLQTKRSVLLL